jgi:hypothetical protein
MLALPHERKALFEQIDEALGGEVRGLRDGFGDGRRLRLECFVFRRLVLVARRRFQQAYTFGIGRDENGMDFENGIQSFFLLVLQSRFEAVQDVTSRRQRRVFEAQAERKQQIDAWNLEIGLALIALRDLAQLTMRVAPRVEGVDKIGDCFAQLRKQRSRAGGLRAFLLLPG